MATSLREFELVTEVSSPGLFFFATDMKVRPQDDYLEGVGLASDHIFSTRPMWDRTIPEAIGSRFPKIKQIYYDQMVGFKIARRSKWFGQNATLNLPLDEYYRYFCGQQSGDNYDQPKIRIKSMPRLSQTPRDGGPIFLARTPQDPNGVFGLELTGSRGYKTDHRGDFWRGRLELSGDNPGQLIVAAVEVINQDITESSIPVWRVREAQGQLPQAL